METVQLLLSASRQIREEVSSMEVDVLVGENMADLLEKSRTQMETSARELQMSAALASGGNKIVALSKR